MQTPTLGRERLSALRNLVFERLRGLARDLLEARAELSSLADGTLTLGANGKISGPPMSTIQDADERIRETTLNLRAMGSDVLSASPLVISVPGLPRDRRELFLVNAEAVAVTFVPDRPVPDPS